MRKWPLSDIFKYIDKAMSINQIVDRLTYYQMPVSAITPGASPYTYQNQTDNDEDVIVIGGTVTAIDYSRDGTTFYGVGMIAGTVRLSPLDKVKVTYTVVPTMTKVPR